MLLWSATRGAVRYELRGAGNSIRLYRDRVFHSQYNGGRPLNGGVWDMLWLPLCTRPAAQIRSVLMLGVGCGAALKKIADYFPDASLTGVDLDAQHLALARRYLKLKAPRCTLHCADAAQWLGGRGGRRYDVIIDDLFTGTETGPERALPMNATWLATLRSRLADRGLLVANCVRAADLRVVHNSASGGFAHALGLREQGFENRIIAASDQPLDSKLLRRNYAMLVGEHWPGQARKLPASLSISSLRSR